MKKNVLMKKRIRKILICFLLIVSIFSCLCFTNSKAKADTDIPNANSYMLNLRNFYQTLQGTDFSISDFVGTNCLATSNNNVFFKVNEIWFNRIYFQLSVSYKLTIYYYNYYTGQRVDVIDNDNVIDYNALNINIPDTSLINNIYLLYESSQGMQNYIPRDLFYILFTRVQSSYPVRNGIYRFNFPDLFGIIGDIGSDVRITKTVNDDILWFYRFIIYSSNDIVLTFDDNSAIYCNIILIGSGEDDDLVFYFLKSDFSNYTSLYYFNDENVQYITDDYPVYDEISTIYFPYDTGIYGLTTDESFYRTFTSEYVFDTSFNYGYTVEVRGWSDFFFNIIDVPVMYLRSLTNFEIFGVNLFYTLTGIMTTLFIIWIIRKF